MNRDEIFVDVKRREALRENEPELRSLRQKLQNDLIRKTQACQIKEKEYASLRDKIMTLKEADVIRNKQINEIKLQADYENIKHKSKKSYGNELQLQMKTKEVSKEKENRIKELERQEIQKMLDNLDAEYQKYVQKKKQLIDDIKTERETMKRAREAEKIKNKLLSLEESRRIDEINQELENRLRGQEEEHKRKLAQREALNSKIAKNLEEQQKAEIERVRLIDELREYEFKYKEDLLDRNRNLKDDNKIKSHKFILEKQIEANLAHKKILKDLEFEYKMQLLNEIKRHKIIEDINRKQSKERQIQYASDVKQQINLNKDKQKENENMVAMTNDYIKQYNAAREKQIQEEKSLMILEHQQKFPLNRTTLDL